jgi:hypothetical protein
LGNELLAHADHARVCDAAIYQEMGEADLEDACHKLFRHANAVALDPQETLTLPRFRLTKKMLDIASHSQRISSEETSVSGSCFQPELRLIRDLRRHARNASSTERLPSALLLGKDDGPFAYQNADGYPTAYAWRSADFMTSSGIRWIPSGAIFELEYGDRQANGVYADDPRHTFKGMGLIALSTTPPPDDVKLKRMSLEFLPEDIRAMALSFAVADISSLKPYQEQAHDLTSRSVNLQVSSLIDQGIPQVV